MGWGVPTLGSARGVPTLGSARGVPTLPLEPARKQIKFINALINSMDRSTYIYIYFYKLPTYQSCGLSVGGWRQQWDGVFLQWVEHGVFLHYR